MVLRFLIEWVDFDSENLVSWFILVWEYFLVTLAALGSQARIHIFKALISVYLSVCLSDHNSVTPRLILIGEPVIPTEMFLAWFYDSKLSGSTLMAKI